MSSPQAAAGVIRDHYVICNWNDLGDAIIRELHASVLGERRAIVIVTDQPERVPQAEPETHDDPDPAEVLGILRVGDQPQNLALVYPRPITFVGDRPAAYDWTQGVYETLGRAHGVRLIPDVASWRPSDG